MTRQPSALQLGPSLIGPILGGLVGTVLVVSLMYAAPVWGGQPVDVLRTMGGVFTSRASAALGIGMALAMIMGVVIWPAVIFVSWAHLPGGRMSFWGAMIKAAVSGLAIWIVFGVALWIGTALNRLSAVSLAGGFGAQTGALAVVALLVGTLLYAIAVAVLGWMENGISPIDALGWKHAYHASSGPRDFAAHRSTPDWIDEAERHD